MCRGPTAVDPPHPAPANIGLWGSRIGAYCRNRLDAPEASRVGSPQSLGLVAGGLALGDGLAGVARGLGRGSPLGLESALETAPLVVGEDRLGERRVDGALVRGRGRFGFG